MEGTESSVVCKREKETRTRLWRQIWNSLERAEKPKTWGMLYRHRVHIAPTFQKLFKTVNLDTVEGVYKTKLGKIISADGESDVIRLELDDEGQTRVFFLKRCWNREARDIFKRATRGSLLGRSSVRAEFEAMQHLEAFGLRVPGLVGYGEQRFCCGVVNSFIVTEEIPKAMGVDFLVSGWMAKQPKELREGLKDALVEEAARCLKLMHENGFEHHDLFLRNMMVSNESMTDLYIIDCPRAYIFPSFIIKSRRIHDLATLDAASTFYLRPTQRMRFMHIYLGTKRLNAEHKALVRKVLSAADPQRERQVLRLQRSIPVDEEGNILSD